METHMNDSVRKHCKPNQAQLQLALGNGLKKLNVYMEKALLSKYPLLGAVLASAIGISLEPFSHSAGSKLELYFSNEYSCNDLDDGVLDWWKMHEKSFPILARIARDVFAIPGVSVAVE
ncbi:hypothetical protein A0H81_13515 [Grifola frondosa]|uniref:HAT C-terminal dimerisation domain-containing protein n=1 Tax=Grifola frondosa TaxID=5627 RepID=A0A1C7LRI8_GRIFR|nr:hypothetical protein A0H81_13515 [Grifola frondosa]